MNVSDIKINELKDEELTNLVADVNKKQLSHLGYLSLYNSIYEGLTIKNDEEDINYFDLIKSDKDRKIIEKNYNDLILIMENIENIFCQSTDKDIDKDIKEILSIRKKLYDYFTLLNSYITELKYVYEIFEYSISYKETKNQYEKFQFSNFDVNTFFQDLLAFLLENSDDYES